MLDSISAKVVTASEQMDIMDQMTLQIAAMVEETRAAPKELADETTTLLQLSDPVPTG